MAAKAGDDHRWSDVADDVFPKEESKNCKVIGMTSEMFDAIMSYLETHLINQSQAGKQVTWQQAEEQQHQAYIATKSPYYGGEEYMKKIDEHISKGMRCMKHIS